jgi:hypothetical protein
VLVSQQAPGAYWRVGMSGNTTNKTSLSGAVYVRFSPKRTLTKNAVMTGMPQIKKLLFRQQTIAIEATPLFTY